jgi:hypothetical protein
VDREIAREERVFGEKERTGEIDETRIIIIIIISIGW